MAKKEAVLDAALDTEVVVMTLMEGLSERAPLPPKEGDIVEGPVIALDRARLYIDLPPFGTGVIFGREYLNARDRLRERQRLISLSFGGLHSGGTAIIT